MRLVLRILAAPLVLALVVIIAVCTFVISVSSFLLGIASVIALLLAVAMFILSSPALACAWLVIAFLLSPVGLPKLAEWLVDRVADVSGALSGFVFG
jgi:hypothetical protein